MSRVWVRFNSCYVPPSSSGLLDDSGRCIKASVHRRRPVEQARWFSPPSDLETSPSAVEALPPLIFLPYLQFDHFGHLLTETAGWLSPLLRRSKPRGLPSHLLLGAWAASSVEVLCNLLSLDRSKVFTTPTLKGITYLPEAWVPVPSMVNRDRIDLRHSRAVRRLLRRMHRLPRSAFNYRAHGTSESEFLYLSRSALASDQRRVDEESVLEDLLQRLGWTVINPEQLSLAKQLQHLRMARVVAGPLGSAFHLLLPFGTLPQGPLMLTLGLADELTEPGPGQNFGLQFARQKLPFEHLPVLRSAQSSCDGVPLPRNANLHFAVPPEQVAQQLHRLARAFVSNHPQ